MIVFSLNVTVVHGGSTRIKHINLVCDIMSSLPMVCTYCLKTRCETHIQNLTFVVSPLWMKILFRYVKLFFGKVVSHPRGTD